MGRLVRVRGAGAVRVARDELLALLAFVVHRVAQRARDRHQEAHERDARDRLSTLSLMMLLVNFRMQFTQGFNFQALH